MTAATTGPGPGRTGFPVATWRGGGRVEGVVDVEFEPTGPDGNSGP
ncbi:hypothetical protein ACFVTY_10305 [Streptomyces sp. NPDC058067]